MTLINHPLDEKQRTIKPGTPHFTVPSEEEMREQMKTIINFNGKTFIELETKLNYKEIKQKAWEIYFLLIKLEYKPPTTLAKIFNKAWETATVFYNRAKEKEQENENE